MLVAVRGNGDAAGSAGSRSNQKERALDTKDSAIGHQAS
jgi:hypothetical protein